MSRNHAAMAALVIGVVGIIMGFVYNNSTLLILGMITMNVGLWVRFMKN